MRNNDQSLRPAASELRRHPVGIALRTLANRDKPSSFEQVTRRGLEDLTRQVAQIEREQNGFLFGLAGSILVELYRSIIR